MSLSPLGFLAQPSGNGAPSLSAVSTGINRPRSGPGMERGDRVTTVVIQQQQHEPSGSKVSARLYQLQARPTDVAAPSLPVGRRARVTAA
jgi:hypothetical protein